MWCSTSLQRNAAPVRSPWSGCVRTQGRCVAPLHMRLRKPALAGGLCALSAQVLDPLATLHMQAHGLHVLQVQFHRSVFYLDLQAQGAHSTKGRHTFARRRQSSCTRSKKSQKTT
jgi:hypothetical protein